jgi:hypothetical protein
MMESFLRIGGKRLSGANRTWLQQWPAVGGEMSKQKVAQPLYMVSIYDDPHQQGALLFTFVPKGEGAKPPPQYILSVLGCGDEATFQWVKPASNHALRAEMEKVARARVADRHQWLERLQKLVTTVQEWASDQDWSTKVVEKKMEDAEVGNYQAPALILQDESVRLYLEPITRAAAGSRGVVDLYLMPSYDDVASLYFYNRRWNLHYLFKGDRTVTTVPDAEAQPLTRESLLKVLNEMKNNAG